MKKLLLTILFTLVLSGGANSAELLRSAGARMNFQTVQGPIIEISEERLKFIIANLERSFVRIEKLLKPEWVD